VELNLLILGIVLLIATLTGYFLFLRKEAPVSADDPMSGITDAGMATGITFIFVGISFFLVTIGLATIVV
jgi:hypothetical protein